MNRVCRKALANDLGYAFADLLLAKRSLENDTQGVSRRQLLRARRRLERLEAQAESGWRMQP